MIILFMVLVSAATSVLAVTADIWIDHLITEDYDKKELTKANEADSKN